MRYEMGCSVFHQRLVSCPRAFFGGGPSALLGFGKWGTRTPDPLNHNQVL